MKPAKILEVLKTSVPLFELFSDELKTEIISNSKVETFAKGELILKYDEEVSSLFVFLEGESKASVVDNCGNEKMLSSYKKGRMVGEVALMTGAKSLCSVTALDSVTTLTIPSKLFFDVILSNPKAINLLTVTVAEHLGRLGSNSHYTDATLPANSDPYGFKLKTDKPAKILVINCGSSSLKYTLFDTSKDGKMVNGQVERIGTGSNMAIEYETDTIEINKELPAGDHKSAFEAVLIELTSKEHGVISSPSEIVAVGHRVVHGGDIFNGPAIITDEVVEQIDSLSSLAPLHNPINIVGIVEARRSFPDADQVAVFDTAFHQTIPPQAFLYGLPYEYYTEKKIRRYGFHGTSHNYVSLKTAEYLKRPYNDLKIITAHLGNGGSVCAVEHGKSVDTSMGLTPAEGVIMGTRCGSIDPAALLHLMDSEGMSSADINRLINKESGLLGLSGVSNDMRDIEAASNNGNERATLAYKAFSYSVRKYIGSYSAVMGGCDALVFTGGIGLYSSLAREEISKGLGALGMYIDIDKSREFNGTKKVVEISTPDSPVKILIVPTDEELMIARETLSALAAAK
jgi:acetate kinase